VIVMGEHTLLIASAHEHQRAFLACQLDADGHTVYEADSVAAAVAKLSAHAINVMVLGDLHELGDAPGLLRAVRAGDHARIHPGQPVITLGADDELTMLRA
jgi:DNA-binding NtrC family response regulator